MGSWTHHHWPHRLLGAEGLIHERSDLAEANELGSRDHYEPIELIRRVEVEYRIRPALGGVVKHQIEVWRRETVTATEHGATDALPRRYAHTTYQGVADCYAAHIDGYDPVLPGNTRKVHGCYAPAQRFALAGPAFETFPKHDPFILGVA
ncbi:MAG: hypothetical protein U0271_20825 [Polyangiaceae bacterium]